MLKLLIKNTFRSFLAIISLYIISVASFAQNIVPAAKIINNTPRSIKHDTVRKAPAVNNPAKLNLKAETEENEEYDNPKGRNEFRRKQRLDDNGELKFDALWNAKKYYDTRWQMKDAGIWAWSWLGPKNIGGRIRTILINPSNPNNMWLGSVSGGIWTTTNAGASWSVVNDFMSNLAITSMAIDPNNTNTLYAATGEGFGNSDGLPGAGIFKSTDGGVTWFQLSSTSGSSFQYVNRIAQSPTTSGLLFAGATSNVYETTNGGSTWTSVLSVTGYVDDVKINPANPNMIVAGTYYDAYLSTNNGSTWTKLTTGNTNALPLGGTSGTCGRCEVAFTAANANYIYISMARNLGEIWLSTNGGSTWTIQSTGTQFMGSQGWYDDAIWVSPVNPNFIVVGGINMYRSTNNGVTLTQINSASGAFLTNSNYSPHPDFHTFVAPPGFDGVTNKRLYIGDDGGISTATDITAVTNSSGWTDLNNSLGITQLYCGAASTNGNVLICGTQDNGTLMHNSATDSLYNYREWLSGDGGFCAINYNCPSTWFGELYYLGMYRTVNSGKQYYTCISGLTNANDYNNALFISPFIMDPNNPKVLVAGGTSIWKTSDSATTWTSIRGTITGTPFCSAIAISKKNSNCIWVGYDNGIVSCSTNGGSTWTNVNTGIPGRYITDIAISPTDTAEVVVTLGGFVTNNIYITTNSGSNWTLVNGTSPNNIGAIQINSVTFNPYNSNWVYVGTDLGILATDSVLGAKWKISPEYTNNEGPANVAVDRLFWAGNGLYLYAATHGRGLFRCMPLSYIYVNCSLSTNGNGTQQNPYNNLPSATANAGPDATIVIQGGTCNDASALLITKRLHFIINNGPAMIK